MTRNAQSAGRTEPSRAEALTAQRPLSGKIAVVTGASRGIGRAVALRLARDGAIVALQYRQAREHADAAVKAIGDAGGRAFALQADIATLSGVERFYESLDANLLDIADSRGFDILVNSAGIADSIDFEHTTESQFDRLFDINVKGLFFMTQRALVRLREGGRVIHVSSVAGRAHFPGIPAYAATKGAVNTLTVHLAAALGHRGITVNAVGPGVTDTDMSAWVRTPEGAAAAKAMQSLQRIGLPEDVADVVGFLASPDARWVTGAYIEASGGLRL